MKRREAEVLQQAKATANAKLKSDTANRPTTNGKGVDNNRSKGKKKIDPAVLERSQLVIWRRPFKTIYYFIKEVPCSFTDAKNRWVSLENLIEIRWIYRNEIFCGLI